MRARARPDRIREHYDELLRAAASLKRGWVPASLVLTRLKNSSPQTPLAAALGEYGRMVRTNFLLVYCADPQQRARITGQLNKGETLHSLRRQLFFAHEGHVRHRHHEGQTEQALCLTIVTNAVVLWNTVYMADALDDLRRADNVGDDAVAHLSPALFDHINPYGRFFFDVEGELGRTSRRPLRSSATATT
jgi:TnpA family transposase